MLQRYRVADGGVDIDRDQVLRFDFDGIRFEGHPGDTLASALLANGVRVVGRSFKYHRPRGIVGIGGEEPNALVRTGLGAHAEPNLKATEVPLVDGLIAESQNRWPSLSFDVGAAAGLLAPFLPAGFYYKTFMASPWGWPAWERRIRRMAGLGRVPEGRDPDHYAKRHVHCDVLVAGGGPTGLVAALAAAQTGVRVVLADENAAFGGGLLQAPVQIDGRPARDWVAEIVRKLRRLENVTLLPGSTVTGYYDHELMTVVERVTDGLPQPEPRLPRQRVWMIRARQVVLATGAIERPQVFPGNDLPRVMLTRALRGYLHRFGVLCGQSVVLCTNNDGAYHAAVELRRAGATVAGIVDSRDPPGDEVLALARSEKVPVYPGHIPTLARGGRRVRALEASRLKGAGTEVSSLVERLSCDVVGVSGGWTPAVHLFSQAGGKLRYDPEIAAFVPGQPGGANRSAGACNGEFDLRSCLWQGFEAGAGAAADTGATAVATSRDSGAEAAGEGLACDEAPVPWTAPPRRGRPRFVDFQNDVTVDDIELAAREGYRSVEHLKRYTTLGMGTEQGKLGNMHGQALLAETLGLPIPSVGTTRFRPPYTPVTMGAMAAGKVGEAGRAVRRTAVYDWHETSTTAFADAGLWKRPRYFPLEGESEHEAAAREARAARERVALADLGARSRIELQGGGAETLLQRLCANDLTEIPVGHGRSVLMLREDGMVFDQGVAMRLGSDHFLVTTEGGTEALLEHATFLHETVWPDLRVFITDVTEHWFAAGLLGPRARDLLSQLSDDLAVPDSAAPGFTITEGRIGDVPVRLLRTEISGAPGFEVHIAADYGMPLWSTIMADGGAYDLEVCGQDALDAIRIENRRPAIGTEADGRTTPDDLGLGHLVGREKDFVGRRSLDLPALKEPGRLQLVGIKAEAPGASIPPGAQIVAEDNGGRPQPSLGHVSSRCDSPFHQRGIGLALVRDGRSRIGETLHAASPLFGETVAVTLAGTGAEGPGWEEPNG